MKRSVTTWLLVGLCAACGSDGRGDANENSAETDGTEQADGSDERGDEASDGSDDAPAGPKLTEITDAQARAICEGSWTLATVTGLTPEQYCTGQGTSLADTKAECIADRDECLEYYEEGEQEALARENARDARLFCEDLTTAKLPRGCAAYTLDEAEQCLSDLNAFYQMIAEMESCDELDAEPAPPEQCAGIFLDCLNRL